MGGVSWGWGDAVLVQTTPTRFWDREEFWGGIGKLKLSIGFRLGEPTLKK
jgi:hypothetical protein